MKRISLLKIIVALCICNAYLFTCGVMGTVESTAPAAADEPAPSEAEVGETSSEDELHGQGTVDFITPDSGEQTQTQTVHIEQLSFAQAPLAEKPVQSTYSASDSEYIEPVIAEEEEDTSIPDTSDDDDFVIVDTYEAEEPEVTTAATTTTKATTAATTSTRVTTTTPEPTTVATTTTTTTQTTTTKATTGIGGGIPVDDTATNATTTEPKQPTEIVTNDDAANEILYVKNSGMTVSGTALEIISRITQNEIGYTFAPEAIKAQAVAAYTYVKYCNKYGSYPSVILSDSVSDSVRVLTASVIGEAVRYNGELIQAVYSASSAGYTASSAYVWGNDYPYLESVYCELDAQYDPNYGRTASFSSDDIKKRVYEKTGISLSGDPSEWITIDSYAEGKYVGQVNIGGYHSYVDSDGDSVKITGRVFRERIMSYDLRSSAFDVSYDAASDTFTFTTYGYGHGVGMSQNGANIIATYWGWDYKQILEFYYTGTEVY